MSLLGESELLAAAACGQSLFATQHEITRRSQRLAERICGTKGRSGPIKRTGAGQVAAATGSPGFVREIPSFVRYCDLVLINRILSFA
jgi:hypothetical protein